MMEKFSERTTLTWPATEADGLVTRGDGPPTKRIEILHRCGTWVRKDMIYCSACGHMLHRKDGTLI